MRYPVTNYGINGIAPSPTPFWQYTGTGYVPVSINLQSSSASAQYDINGTDPIDLVRFEQYMLGWSYKSNTGYLKRYTPAFCPARPYMFASHISGAEGLGNTGQFTAGGSASATWKLMRYTVQFETMPYRVLTDQQLGEQSESRRFTSFDISPSLEVFKRDRGQFKWPANTPDLANQVITDGTAMMVCKQRIVVTWHQLPDDGLFTAGGFFYGGVSPKIEGGLGRVNSTVFMGRNPGTMLLESWKPLLRTMPNLDLVGLTQAGDRSVFRPSWDAQFIFSYFVPPGPNALAVTEVQGHCTVPHPTTNVWYRPYLAGGADVAGNWRYNIYDMNQLFELN